VNGSPGSPEKGIQPKKPPLRGRSNLFHGQPIRSQAGNRSRPWTVRRLSQATSLILTHSLVATILVNPKEPGMTVLWH